MKLTRNPLSRIADEARALISRLRALAGIHDPRGADAHPSQSDGALHEALPRKADNAWAPERPREASVSLTTRLIDEDGEESDLAPEFATATMGHILLGQSQPDAARQMFLAVHARNPEDAEARRGLELTGGVPDRRPSPKKSQRPATRASEPWEMLDRAPPPASYGVAEAHALAVDPTSVVVFWEITSVVREEAARSLGDGAVTSLCVVSLQVGAKGAERSERWVDGIPDVGDYFVTGLPLGATHLCTVGLRAGERFVPVVHAEPVVAPRGKVSPTTARVRATLVIPAPADRTRPRIVSLSGPADALAVASAQMLTPPAQVVVASHPAGSDELLDLMQQLSATPSETSSSS